MVVVEAAANTSTGAPCTICAASVSLPPYENLMVVPGCAVWNICPSWLNVPVSEAAASTVMVPLRLGLLPAPGVDVDELDLPLLPQPANASAATIAAADTATKRFLHMGFSIGS